MDKANRLMDSLDMAEAVCWLKEMTGSEMDEARLLRLCVSGQCSVYLDCLDRYVEIPGEDDLDPPYPSKGLGLSKVLKPIQLINNSSVIELRGTAALNSTGARIEKCSFFMTFEMSSPKPLFIPADIEALASRMNGNPIRLKTLELNELERERAARKAAEAEVLELRKKLEDISSAEKISNEGKQHQQDEKEIIQSEAPITGLLFPYTTMHLEAMQQAATKYWVNHDRSKPAPYGIQKKVQNFIAERTGDNSRKTAELSVAIKPNDLPKH